MIGAFDREGHLSPLGLHLVATGEAEGAAAYAHSANCPACAARLRGLIAELAQPLPPLQALPTPTQTTPPRGQVVAFPRRPYPYVAASLALAAAALLAVVQLGRDRAQAPGELDDPVASADQFSSRGATLRLEVYRDAPEGAERLAEGSRVAPGDRLGFRFASTSPGHLIVFGIDEAGAVYPIWPGASASAPVEAAPGGRQLDVAVSLDDAPGAEQIVALRCDGPVHLDALAGAPGEAPIGCAREVLRLQKVTP